MSDAADAVEQARAAWGRLQRHGRRSWDDWCTVGKALAIGRETALQRAGTDKPRGRKFTDAISEWLEQAGLDTVPPPARCRALLVHEHLAEISAWRATLPPAVRDQLNHPDSVWLTWRRSQQGPRRTAANHEPPPSDLWDVIREAVHATWDIGDELVAAQKIYHRVAMHLNPRTRDKPRQRTTAAVEHVAA